MRKNCVLDYFSTTNKVAEFLGISQAAVSKWKDVIPEKQAFKLASLTKGKLIYDPALYSDNANQKKEKKCIETQQK